VIKYELVFMWSPFYLWQILKELEFSQQIFEKYLNVKFRENPSNGRRVVPCGRTEGQTEMTKLRDAFSIIANAPKNRSVNAV